MLSIVATPIGNLEDMTLRGMRVLREADLIACEDTRQTARLTRAYDITTRLISYHQHSSSRTREYILAQLGAGRHVALVTDGGTPGISDPGAELIAAALEQGTAVTIVPGACAVIGALAVAGLPTDGFLFLGFPPRRPGRIRKLFVAASACGRTVVFYESPYRVRATIALLRETAGSAVRVSVVRELTKKFEEVIRGPIDAVLAQLSARTVQGEVTVVYRQTDEPARRD